MDPPAFISEPIRVEYDKEKMGPVSFVWRGARYELRAFGRNLGDRRDPVSESELGDAQYYRMTARRFDVLASFRF